MLMSIAALGKCSVRPTPLAAQAHGRGIFVDLQVNSRCGCA
ncbi:hypothetical protein NY08_2810 [Rhodococcus sp. B7740]|nr:hypothetical protein NY08_2810 [Rhodococcus sp. B7740]